MKNIGFLHNMLPPQYCVTGPRWVNEYFPSPSFPCVRSRLTLDPRHVLKKWNGSSWPYEASDSLHRVVDIFCLPVRFYWWGCCFGLLRHRTLLIHPCVKPRFLTTSHWDTYYLQDANVSTRLNSCIITHWYSYEDILAMAGVKAGSKYPYGSSRSSIASELGFWIMMKP